MAYSRSRYKIQGNFKDYLPSTQEVAKKLIRYQETLYNVTYRNGIFTKGTDND